MIDLAVTLPHLNFPVSNRALSQLTTAEKADAAHPACGSPADGSDADERRLVEGLRRGDREALEEMIARHGTMVAGLVSRLNSWSGDSDDLVQDVFVAALHGAKRFRGQSRVSTWLTRVAINVCRQHHRTRMLRRDFWKRWMSRGDAPQTTEDSDASKSVERDERIRQVTHAVRRLKGKYREVVVLHYLQEMSIDDVTKVLGLSRGAVEMRLHRGRQMLQEILAPTIAHESP